MHDLSSGAHVFARSIIKMAGNPATMALKLECEGAFTIVFFFSTFNTTNRVFVLFVETACRFLLLKRKERILDILEEEDTARHYSVDVRYVGKRRLRGF